MFAGGQILQRRLLDVPDFLAGECSKEGIVLISMYSLDQAVDRCMSIGICCVEVSQVS